MPGSRRRWPRSNGRHGRPRVRVAGYPRADRRPRRRPPPRARRVQRRPHHTWFRRSAPSGAVQIDLVGEVGGPSRRRTWCLSRVSGTPAGPAGAGTRRSRPQLGALVVAELALEEAGQVLQHVDVAGRGGADGERPHEARAVGRQVSAARREAGRGTRQARELGVLATLWARIANLCAAWKATRSRPAGGRRRNAAAGGSEHALVKLSRIRRRSAASSPRSIGSASTRAPAKRPRPTRRARVLAVPRTGRGRTTVRPA